MNVSLTPELEQLVNEKVESGFYQTASEVVREALRLLSERDQERAPSDRCPCRFRPACARAGKVYGKASGRRLIERIKSNGRTARAKKR